MVAGLVKVLQVEGVVPDLVNRSAVKRPFADFEFQGEDNRPDH